ncbi:MAG: LytR/AlgR family response regulator transcription factor [Anaerobutyricum soehngenii]
MLKVAICDDSSMYSEKIETFVTRFGAANLVEVKTEVFTSGSQLMLYFGEKKFDLIFLDISMPGLDGLETASRIRKIDLSVPIVFCTSYYEFTNIQRSIQIGAKDFLKKPIVYKKVEALLNQVYNQKLINAEEKLILKNQNEVRAIQISDIIYLQTQNKAVVIHTTQCNFVSYQKLYKFEEKLGEKLFCRCHNSFLINLDYVEGLHNDFVMMRDKKEVLIPVSKYKKEQLLKMLANYVSMYSS